MRLFRPTHRLTPTGHVALHKIFRLREREVLDLVLSQLQPVVEVAIDRVGREAFRGTSERHRRILSRLLHQLPRPDRRRALVIRAFRRRLDFEDHVDLRVHFVIRLPEPVVDVLH